MRGRERRESEKGGREREGDIEDEREKVWREEWEKRGRDSVKREKRVRAET